MSFEWLEIDERELAYHLDQYASPKAYTLHLLDLFRSSSWSGQINSVLDFGCGGGAVTNFFARYFPNIAFTGLDINPKYVELSRQKGSANSDFLVFDIYRDADYQQLVGRRFDAIFSFQTLSWLPSYEPFLTMIDKVRPNYCLITSLFYNGPVEAEIKVKDFTRTMGAVPYRETFYNIYSLPQLEEKLQALGYTIGAAVPFEIGIDLPKPKDGSMATFTETLNNNKRIQISGPLLMSWHTLTIQKRTS